MDNTILDLIFNAKDSGIITFSEFITPEIYKKIQSKYDDINIESFGKIRKIYAFIPNHIKDFDFPIKLLEIKVNNKFKTYTNRDFLGSIMALNIKRSLLGDIFVKNNVAYVYVLEDIVEFIMSNLKKIGLNNCLISISDKKDLEFKFESLYLTISSNRLDNLICAITNMSRNESVLYIEQGFCKLNYELCLQKSKIIDSGSILSLKKYGRFLVGSAVRRTKKDKIVINIQKFI
ncbi:YlmH/Sll1252 family protein [Caviibacter abscessus]|uniref:YlmH/Sll1252 family protein n=1 Tax=Caviibacter abscessus TaxID=1766719 RepID=UPI000837FA18|nr:YlmH/Sll1252 family protein [Caviibacter abscessus]